MNFCNVCGQRVTQAIPEGDNRVRYVCTHCGTIHYENPKIIVGTIPEWQGQILLCRRAIDPRKGYWTIPAGFMENGESTAEAAMRETLEESGAEVTVKKLFSLMSIPDYDEVHLFFHAELNQPTFAAGEESLEVKLFDIQEIPWHELAFSTVYHALCFYIADRQAGLQRHHIGKIYNKNFYNEFGEEIATYPSF